MSLRVSLAFAKLNGERTDDVERSPEPSDLG